MALQMNTYKTNRQCYAGTKVSGTIKTKYFSMFLRLMLAEKLISENLITFIN